MVEAGAREARVRPWRAAALAALVALAGCAMNEPLKRGEPASPAYRYETLSRFTDPGDNSDEVLVIVALSGGGARAAALGFGVLEQLAATRIRPAPGSKPRSVLAEVDLISSNSGGSFLAAYYAIHREAMFRVGDDGKTSFERDFLKRRVATELLANVALNVRPQAQFDLICSDLGSVPVARAVVASSAVHGIFTPLRLRNHPERHCPPEPAWIAAALRGEGDPASIVDAPQARRSRALLARWYREKLPDGLKAPAGTEFFVHLADGAGADNLGLRAPILALASRDSTFAFARLIKEGRIKRVLLIAVNAATGPDPLRDADRSGPSALQSMRDAADGLIRATSEQTLQEAQFVFAQLRAAAERNGGAPKFYGPVAIGFDAVEDDRRRRCFKRIRTTLDLPAAEVDALRLAGRQLLARAEEFRRFVKDQNGEEALPTPLSGAMRFCSES
jgi:NTE family protein